MYLVPLWPNIILTTVLKHKNVTKQLYYCIENLQGIDPMGLSAPLADSYPRNCSETPNCHKNLEMIDFNPVSKFMMTIVKKNWHPLHDLSLACREIKSVFPVCIRPTDKLQSQPRTSFTINEL